MGLNESYLQIRAQILLIDPLPPINRVFSLIIHEERQRSIGSSSSIESITLLANSERRFSSDKSKKKDTRPICSNCGYNDTLLMNATSYMTTHPDIDLPTAIILFIKGRTIQSKMDMRKGQKFLKAINLHSLLVSTMINIHNFWARFKLISTHLKMVRISKMRLHT